MNYVKSQQYVHASMESIARAPINEPYMRTSQLAIYVHATTSGKELK